MIPSMRWWTCHPQFRIFFLLSWFEAPRLTISFQAKTLSDKHCGICPGTKRNFRELYSGFSRMLCGRYASCKVDSPNRFSQANNSHGKSVICRNKVGSICRLGQTCLDKYCMWSREIAETFFYRTSAWIVYLWKFYQSAPSYIWVWITWGKTQS